MTDGEFADYCDWMDAGWQEERTVRFEFDMPITILGGLQLWICVEAESVYDTPLKILSVKLSGRDLYPDAAQMLIIKAQAHKWLEEKG